MASMERVRDFLSQKRLAFVGVSRQPKDYSRALFREFGARGYDAVPVNPAIAEIEGCRCFARVQDIEPVSYTHLDVYKRQELEAKVAR